MGAFLFSFTACNTIPDESRQLKTRNVTLEYHDKKRDRDIEGKDLQHPFTISPEQMERQIRSIYYEHLALMSSKEPVFNKVQLPDLKRLLTKAIHHAKPNHYISFTVEGDGGETKGDLFAINGKLHWRLNKINGEKFTRKAWARNEQLWKLTPRSGQEYYTKKILMEREILNWIVSSLDLPPTRSSKNKKRLRNKHNVRSASPPPAVTAPTAKEQELERKLGILNKLKDKGLIDNAEFERRRKALLDEYL